ncbi:hypothetical protein Golob_014698, partial [Gossypium lobatum]|nr:hypothetical protein [Gossypium lobatum]
MANPNGNNNVNEQNDARFPLVVSPAPRSIRDYAIPHAKRLCTSIRFLTVETFYTSLRESIKGNLDTIGNGTLLSKSPKKSVKIIEETEFSIPPIDEIFVELDESLKIRISSFTFARKLERNKLDKKFLKFLK